MKVIFLDVDGVLNCTTSKSRCGMCVGIDTDKIRRLKEIVDATDAKIVLTTTWKDHYELGAYKQTEQFAKYLSNKFRKFGLRVLDKVRDKRWTDRGEAILKWLDEHPDTTHWLILDDQRFLKYDDERIEPHWVRTYWRGHGLTEPCMNAAIAILNGKRHGAFYDEEDYEKCIRWRIRDDSPLGWAD